MRELKFRVYDSNQKKLVYFDLHNIIVPDRLLCQYDCPVQQFTGLLDAGGREIYEGDIIKLEGSPYTYEVVWNKWQWGIDSKGVVTDFIQGFTSAVEDRAIIIGNIFENPELLKQ